MQKTKFGVMSILIGLTLLFSACSPTPTVDPAPFYTAAAQTVEAQLTQTALHTTFISTATMTPTSTFPTTTPIATLTPSQGSGTSGEPPCLAANFIGDVSIPDGTIITPGATFVKTWRVKNSGSCTWDAGYSLVHAGGDPMGGTLSVPLPRIVYPDQTVDISIELTAPMIEGIYTGEWRLKTRWGGTMGVGQYDASLSVIINVSTSTNYAVTSVQYTVTRQPPTGCPFKVWFTITATIKVNGPTVVKYHWARSDDYPDYAPHDPIEFGEAGSTTVSYTWLLYEGANNKPRWVALYIDEPNHQLFGKAEFLYGCP